MAKETKRKGHSRQSRWPGIVEHAHALGVSHSHLWRVLAGRRQSRRLWARYLDLTNVEPHKRGTRSRD